MRARAARGRRRARRPARPAAARPPRAARRRHALDRPARPRRLAPRSPAGRARSASTPTCSPPAGSRCRCARAASATRAISARGPLGLGTEFELVRDYLPDDDVRQVNWRATARLGRPMSNQYRTEQDRDVIVGRRRRAACRPRRCRRRDGRRAPDRARRVPGRADRRRAGRRRGRRPLRRDRLRRRGPRRRSGPAARRAPRSCAPLFDLQPRPVDADYELAFRRVEGAKRAFVLVLADLLEEAAARPLVEAMPVLTRRHAVVVASPADPGLDGARRARAPETEGDLARAAVARRGPRGPRRAPPRSSAPPAPRCSRRRPTRLPRACVAAYLRAKARARL